MDFGKVAGVYAEIESTSSYLKIRDILAGFVKRLSPTEVRIFSYFTLGTIGPGYEDTDLGLAEKMLCRVVASAYDVPEKEVKKLMREIGDMGEVAARLCKRTRSGLSISDVYDALWEVKKSTGAGSHEKKVRILSGIIKKASRMEAKYAVRIALGKLRLGVGDKALLDAFAIAFTGDLKNRKAIEESFNVKTDIGGLGEVLAKGGIRTLEKSSVSVARPVLPMLAQRTGSFQDLLKKMPGEIAAEEKYDGERVQIHKDGNKVIAFSRRLENITNQYPEIMEGVRKQVKAKKAVLDGEIVPLKGGRIGTFQELMQRKRKHDIEKYRKEIPAAVFLFDIIYVSGKSLLSTPYNERREILESSVKESDTIKLSKRIVTGDMRKLKKFFEDCVRRGLEGIIAKSTSKDSVYQAGKRGWLWIKWKKDYAENQDSFDLVVIGSYSGRGRRGGHFGALLGAVYNRDSNFFESFTKVGSGYTDKDFGEIERLLKPWKRKDKPVNVRIEKAMEPDVYYEPKIVIEVTGAEITRSPAHVAGKDRGKGYALRFPRFLRIRPDKGPREATTVKEVRELVK
jgi:DNA ligase-1